VTGQEHVLSASKPSWTSLLLRNDRFALSVFFLLFVLERRQCWCPP
jgi:hypothetical protein